MGLLWWTWSCGFRSLELIFESYVEEFGAMGWSRLTMSWEELNWKSLWEFRRQECQEKQLVEFLYMRCQKGSKDSVGTCTRDILPNNQASFFLCLEKLSKTEFNSNRQISLGEGVQRQLTIQAMGMAAVYCSHPVLEYEAPLVKTHHLGK